MRANRRGTPFIHHHESTRAMMIDMLLALSVLYAICYYYYGPRVIVLGLLSMGAAVLSDWLCTLVARRRIHPRDLSPMVTGLILPLLMPASIEFYIPVLAVFFGIVVAKGPFGGYGNNVFNPAAVGFAFAAVCFPLRTFSYPTPMTYLPMFPVREELATAISPALTLSIGGIPQYDLVDMLLGNTAGPMGAINILVILACLLYLIFRGTLRWEIPVFFLLSSGILSFWFPRSPLLSGADSLMYEMMGGMLLFGGVFMLGDPVTTPKRDWAKIFYAVLAGAVVMLFRHVGGMEESFAYALLLLNATVWVIDMAGELVAGFFRRKRLEALERQKISKKP